MNKKTLRFALWFLIIWAGVSLLFPRGNQENKDVQFIFQPTSSEFSQGSPVQLKIENHFPYALEYKTNCPGQPFEVKRTINGVTAPITAIAEDYACPGDVQQIKPGEKLTLSYGQWNRELFWELGSYTITGTFTRVGDLPVAPPSEVAGPVPESQTREYAFTASFAIVERGFFSMAMLKLFYQPIYNFLVYLMEVLPGHNIGFAIIILTLVIRLALFIPTLHSLKSQRALQELQPKLQEVRAKHKDNQQLMAQETMKLYKEHGVNPFGSCLPILIQMPFLFAVFYVLRTGLDPSNMYLLYSPLANFDFGSVATSFLTFDMTKAEPITYAACTGGLLTCFNLRGLIMPILVGGLQALSSWLTVRRTKSAQAKAVQKEKKPADVTVATQQKTMNIMTVAVMPVMIAWFALMYPAGLSLYWAMTTVFSIGQQMYLAKRHVRAKVAEQK